MSTFPAFKATMGDTPYYVCKLSARDLTRMASTISDEELNEVVSSDSEKWQRTADMKRVDKEIVPYLLQSENRFFGAFILWLIEPESCEFTPFSEVTKLDEGLKLFKKDLSSIGILNFDGGKLRVLDGQHRFHALKRIIANEYDPVVSLDTENGNDFSGAITNDELTVIILNTDDVAKARTIFNKVNTHAKPLGKGDKIITSEDNAYAIITRRLYDGNLFSREHVKVESNTIQDKNAQFTTIATLNVITELLIQPTTFRYDLKPRKSGVKPTEQLLNLGTDIVEKSWRATINAYPLIQEFLDLDRSTKSEDGSKYSPFRAKNCNISLLFRPVGQQILFRGIVKAMELSKAAENGMLSFEECLNMLQGYADLWTFIEPTTGKNNRLWNLVILQGDRINVKSSDINMGANIIAHLILRKYQSTSIDEDSKKEIARRWAGGVSTAKHFEDYVNDWASSSKDPF